MDATIYKQNYVVDTQGKKKGVLLSVKEYEQLLEDLHDLTVLASRRAETPISLDELKQRML